MDQHSSKEEYSDVASEMEMEINSAPSESDEDEITSLGEFTGYSYVESTQDVPLTPFNMKEELSEGFFDADGTYHYKKNENLTDNWLEHIDRYCSNPRVPVKSKTTCEVNKTDTFDSTNTYTKMLSYLHPNETVASALTRLGGKKTLTTIERIKLKKQGTLTEASENSKKISELTGLANSVLENAGDFDIYQETYEGLLKRINANKNSTEVNESLLASNPNLDMYGDDFESKEKAFLERKN